MLSPSKHVQIVHLTWWIYHYRIPLFDELYRRLGSRFIVVAHKNQATPNNQDAVAAGRFPRLLLSGKHFELKKRIYDGRGTPLGLTFTPGLFVALRRLRPILVISINFNTWTLLSMLLGFPTIVFWEGTPFTERTVEWWRRTLRRWMARRAIAFIVNGRMASQYLVENLGVRRGMVFEGGLSPLMPPQKFVEIIRSTPIGRQIEFLFVGRLIPLKGCDHLIESAVMLRQRVGPSFRLCFVGTGPEQDKLTERAQASGLQDLVRFVGAVRPEDVWNYYAEADVFVLPTLHDNWPLVVPEAMLLGMPILLSKYAGSVPDLISEGENGFVFDPSDHAQLASLMEQYLLHPELIRIHGTKSKQIVQAYTPERIADAFMAAVEFANGELGCPIELKPVDAVPAAINDTSRQHR